MILNFDAMVFARNERPDQRGLRPICAKKDLLSVLWPGTNAPIRGDYDLNIIHCSIAKMNPERTPRSEGITTSFNFSISFNKSSRNERPDQRGLRRFWYVLSLTSQLTRNERPDQRGLRHIQRIPLFHPPETRNERPDQRGLRQCVVQAM